MRLFSPSLFKCTRPGICMSSGRRTGAHFFITWTSWATSSEPSEGQSKAWRAVRRWTAPSWGYTQNRETLTTWSSLWHLPMHADWTSVFLFCSSTKGDNKYSAEYLVLIMMFTTNKKCLVIIYFITNCLKNESPQFNVSDILYHLYNFEWTICWIFRFFALGSLYQSHRMQANAIKVKFPKTPQMHMQILYTKYTI